jgi:hypothetical protein
MAKSGVSGGPGGRQRFRQTCRALSGIGGVIAAHVVVMADHLVGRAGWRRDGSTGPAGEYWENWERTGAF